MSAILDVNDVRKSFRIPSVRRDTVREHVLGLLRPRRLERLDVLTGIGFSLRRGETLAIMGRNGCGKSTLLKIICGVYQPDGGQVTVSAGVTPILELGLGWNPELDAVDNVCLVGSIMGLSLREIRSRLDRILDFAELAPFARLRLKHYSSGMASRLGYAVAFEAAREILVLDEVFAVGDAGFRARCEARFRELRAAGHSILLVSHDVRVVSIFCDRALLMSGGQIAMEGPGHVIARQYAQSLLPGHVSNADVPRLS